MDSSVIIDVRGLKCPLPVLKTERGMRSHPQGTRFQVLATDPMAALDIPNFCREGGHLLIEQGREGEALRFTIEKGARRAS